VFKTAGVGDSIKSITEGCTPLYDFDVYQVVYNTKEIDSPWVSLDQMHKDFSPLNKRQISAVVEVFKKKHGDIDAYIIRNVDNQILYHELLNTVRNAKG